MDRQTKTIKCPKCRSIQVKELKSGTFLCDDCGKIFHDVERRYEKLIAFGFVVAIIFAVFIVLSSSSKKKDYEQYILASKIVVVDNEPLALIVVLKVGADKNSLVLLNLSTKEIVRQTEIESGHHHVELREFYDGLYLRTTNSGSNVIYKISPENLVKEDLGNMLKKSFSDLRQMRRLNFVDSVDAFHVTTSKNQYYYSTYSNKLYLTLQDLANDSIIPVYKNKAYVFYTYKSGEPEEEIRLLECEVESQNKILQQHIDGNAVVTKQLANGTNYYRTSNLELSLPLVLGNNDKEVFILCTSESLASPLEIQCISTENWLLDRRGILWAHKTDNYIKAYQLHHVDFNETEDKYVFSIDGKYYYVNKSDPTSLIRIDLDDFFIGYYYSGKY